MSQPHHLITTGVIVHDAKPDSKPNQFVISAGFAKLWNWILNRLSDQPQLKICQKRDRQGNLYWQVYRLVA